MSPRRWTLAGFHTELHEGDYIITPDSIRPELAENEMVPVREDIITEADRRAVVDFLDAWRYCPVSSSPNPSRQCLEDAAGQLLAVVLGSDKDGEDA